MSIDRDSEYYDDIYERYQEKYSCNYKESEYFPLWEKIITKIPKEIPIIELGCGTGQFAQMLIDQEFKYIRGFDFSEFAIIAAQAVRLDTFLKRDLTDGKINGDFFIALEIFEHTRDYKIIENIGLGKEIIFTVPDFNDAAHVRYFKSINDVVERYKNVIQFEYIEKFEKWFICKGVII